jgi:D-arabinonate dehydratase/D-galactarolactone cycloisomerase
VYSDTIDTTIVKVTTDSGQVGWGEAKAPVAPTVTATIVEDVLAGLLVGEDPTDPALHWEQMYGAMRIRGHSKGFWMEAMSGVDIALWDLAAKAADISVSTLLGGRFRERVETYASGIPGLRREAPEEAWEQLIQEAHHVKDLGFGAVKLAVGLGVDADVQSVKAVREALGANFTILADAAGMYDEAQAEKLGNALEELDVRWLEAPLPPEEVEGYGRLNGALRLPIASDLVYNRWQVRDLLRAGGVDVVQPDLCRAGGITGCRRVAELADAFHKPITPHVSIGSAIHFAASAHLASTLPNQTIMEFWYGENPLGNALLETPLSLEEGFLSVPDGSGLGIEIEEAKLRRWEVNRTSQRHD